jgi:hypothetical protein
MMRPHRRHRHGDSRLLPRDGAARRRRVTVRPSHVRGRWDFAIHGLDVRHVLSIAVPPSLLPDLIPRRLQESLNRVVGRNVDGAVRRTHDLLRAV